MEILVVEPNRSGSRLLQRELEPHGYAVITCESAEKALETVSAMPSVGIVLVNLAAGDAAGLELCWHLRLLAGPTRPLYVLAMSADRAGDALIEALDCGADDIISLPLAPKILFARLRAAERLIRLQRETVRLATHDPLSGSLNRRAFMDRAKAAIEMRKADEAVSIALLDIDRFKSLNDNFGHEAGDMVIKELAVIARDQSGVFARLGGEEFAILYSGCTGDLACELANGFRISIARRNFSFGPDYLSVTGSFGVAEARPGESVSDVVRRADRALYSAKRKGRNRVELAGMAPRLAEPPAVLAS